MFSVVEFPDQASITDLDEQETIKSLAQSSILYSACSSFAALSGNSDLQLHASNQSASVGLEMEGSSATEGSKNSGSGESDEGGEDDATGNKDDEEEPESDEEDDEEGHREPIDHLLKVTIFSSHHIRHIFV